MRWKIGSLVTMVLIGRPLVLSPVAMMAVGPDHDDSSTPAGHSGALDGGPDRPVFAADPAAGANSGGRRRAGARPPYRDRRPAGHGAGTGADLHHLPSSAQPQHMVQCRSGPAPAWAAGGGVRAERAGCGRPG